MHIMMLTNDTNFAYNLRREVLQRFVAEGHEVSLVSQVLKFQDELEGMGITIINVKTPRQGKNPFSDLKLWKQYAEILKKKKPDIVFTNNIKPNVYCGMACQKLKIPYVVNVCGLGTPVETPGPMQIFTCFLYKLGIKGAKAIFFQNSANEKFFRDRNLINNNTAVILLPGSGVNLQGHPLLPYPEKDETIHFLYIARLLKEKGIDILLSSAKIIHEKYPNTMFHVVGGCDDHSYLQVMKKAEDDGYVQYHGEQKDVTPFFAQCHAYVYPSYYPEGMSNVLLEAAASGRPAIAADRAGCRETVDDGETGFVVPIKDEQSVVNALETLINMGNEERKAMGIKGRAKVEKEFDRNLVVTEYLKLVH